MKTGVILAIALSYSVAAQAQASEDGDILGYSLAAGDFDFDGQVDLAVGIPGEGVGSLANAGRVAVFEDSLSYTSTFLTVTYWGQDSSGIADTAEANDKFGWTLAVGNFNGDNYADLVVGVPDETVGAVSAAGVVHVIYGSSSGLTSTGSQLWYQDSSGILDSCETGDRFGEALAAGDFNDDGYDDLAIGAPGETINGLSDAGAVSIIYGSLSGLTSTDNQFWHQDSTDILGTAEAGDEFGSALAAANFGYTGHEDLAIGASGEDISATTAAGGIHVVFGTGSGLSAADNQFWDQSNADVPGEAEAYDEFGFALAAGNIDGDYADLAVGVPFEDIGAVADAGYVNILYGGSTGFGSDQQGWAAADSGMTTSAGANFGYAVDIAFLRNVSSYRDLAVGAPGYNNGAGAVVIVLGSSSGLTSATSGIFDQDTSNVYGTSQAADSFGFALAAGDFSPRFGWDRAELAIGVPYQAIGSATAAGLVNILDKRMADYGIMTNWALWEEGNTRD